VDFNHNFPNEEVASWWSWRVLKALAPTPRVRFLLIVPPEESARRSKLKNEPFPDSPETLAWRYARYQALADTGKWQAIDCQASIETVNQKILAAYASCD
jgi:dTMP kinase